MNRKKSIVYLRRSQLEPHPDNPRKDLGDLEELRESIRQNGIMQNLTVIPTDDSLEHFRILIGHRRFAASEGILNELPCVIVEDLTDREQVGIMLCENLQRNDLTFYEQGQGFQMMLDLGDTIDEISEKTGFSKNTVKHRVEIAKLPKAAIEDRKFQLTIGDLIELEKISDVKKRQKVLELAWDSNNLKNRISQEVREEKIQKNMKLVKDWLKKCKINKDNSGMQYSSEYEKVITIELEDLKGLTLTKLQAKVGGKDGLAWCDSYGKIYVCRKLTKKEKPERKKSQWEIEREKQEVKRKQIRETQEAYIKSVLKFLNEADERDFRAGTGVYAERAWKILLRLEAPLERYCYDRVLFEDHDAGDEFYKELQTKPLLWQMLFYVLQSIQAEGFCTYSLTPEEDSLAAVEDLNSILHSLGYNVPDELDASILDGTSELYEPGDDD